MTAFRVFEVEAPIGTVRCAASAKGLALVTLPGSSFERQLAEVAGNGARIDTAKRHPAKTELQRYFAWRLRDFTCPVDLRSVTPFRRRVLEALHRVRFGELVTYGELASRAGSPGAARAVGGAVGANPLPVIVP